MSKSRPVNDANSEQNNGLKKEMNSSNLSSIDVSTPFSPNKNSKSTPNNPFYFHNPSDLTAKGLSPNQSPFEIRNPTQIKLKFNGDGSFSIPKT